MTFEKNDPALGKFGPLSQPLNSSSINNAPTGTMNSFHGVAPFRFDCVKSSSLSQPPATQVSSKEEIKQSEIISQGVKLNNQVESFNSSLITHSNSQVSSSAKVISRRGYSRTELQEVTPICDFIFVVKKDPTSGLIETELKMKIDGRLLEIPTFAVEKGHHEFHVSLNQHKALGFNEFFKV